MVFRNVWLAALILLLPGSASAQDATDVRTAQAALNLLPHKPASKVALIDVGEAPTRDRFRGIDAFIVRGDSRIFVVVNADLFRRAKESEFYRFALAAVIHHEAAHLEGADEVAAQRAEEDLWKMFIRDEKVERRAAFEYLRLMTARRNTDHVLPAAR